MILQMAPHRVRLGCTSVFYHSVFLFLIGHLVSLTDGNCGHIIFTERTGEFKTPDYPKTYPSHSKCSWLIKAPSGYKIKLQYFDFVLESSFNCNSDNVKIYEGKNSSATLIGKYCGKKNPFNVETPRSYMYITFKSDRSLNYRGFKASFVMEAMRPIKSMIFKRTLMDTTVRVVGQQVKFTCQVKDGSLNIVISWTKDGKSLSRSKSNFTMIKNSSYNKKSTLLLTRVSKHDAGEYNCTVEDIDMGRKISSSGSLLVKEAASIKESPSTMNVSTGDTVVMNCQAYGDPIPRIRWKVNGEEKTAMAIQKNFTSQLKFTADINAVVNCTAANQFGMDWKATNIVVTAPVILTTVTDDDSTTFAPSWSSPVITIVPANLTAELGANVTLKCAAEGDPKPKIRWLTEGKYYEDLPEDENGVSLFTLTVIKDRTAIQCEAKNSHNIDSKTAYITAAKVDAAVESNPSSGVSTQLTIILVMAFVVLAVLFILCGVLVMNRRGNFKLKNLPTPVDLEKLQNNPIYEQHTNYYVNPQLLNWQVSRNGMEFIKELGHGNGNFSSLFLASVNETKVENDKERKGPLFMVKLLKEKYSLEEDRRNFEKDAIALTTFSHPYVQNLYGVCVDSPPLCLVFEFSEHDECLQQFLIESGRGHCSIHRRTDIQNAKPKLSNIDQISIAKQIASGMEYLADKGYVHRELCTKNCIMGKGMVVKISNLGFSWKGPNSDYFSLGSTERAGYPVRWLPPETLQYGVFEEDTDIWSFGVVLWEIYSSGLTPYYGMNDDEVISLVNGGDILPCPKECPKEMYEIMQGCWKLMPTERPRFDCIHHQISSLFNGVPV